MLLCFCAATQSTVLQAHSLVLVVVPEKDVLADAFSLGIHLANAEMHIASNAALVVSLDVAYTATISGLLAQLPHLLHADPTVAVAHFLRPEEGQVLPNVHKPICLS